MVYSNNPFVGLVGQKRMRHIRNVNYDLVLNPCLMHFFLTLFCICSDIQLGG